MKYPLLRIALLVSLCYFSAPAFSQKKLLILGSSTSACYGPTNAANCYVNRLKAYYNRNSAYLTIDNRAVGGYNVYKSMPKNYVAPAGRDTVQPYFNITDGLAGNPDVVLINYPSNGYDVFSVAEVMKCFRIIKETATKAGKPCYITTTQPRTGFDAAARQKLRILKDSIIAEFGSAAIDFWSGLADPATLAIAAPYQATGDQVHMNDDAHAILFNRVLEKHLIPEPVAVSFEKPVANAGTDINIQLPINAVTLDGSKCAAPGSMISAYKWSYLSGPAGAIISTPATATTKLSNLLQGVYIFRLTVTNQEGWLAMDDVTITVNGSSLTANAGKDETISYGQATVLHGENSTSTGSPIVKYSWKKYSGPEAYQILNPDSKATWIRNMTAGTYIYRLIVQDSIGHTATDDVTITVKPQIQLTASAGNDQAIISPVSSVSLDGTRSTATGCTITSYSWSFVSGPSGSVIVSPLSGNTLVNGLVEGKYIFRLTVKSNTGSVASDEVAITVNPKTLQSLVPIADAGKDETIPVGQATVLRGANSSAPGGSIVSYAWTKYSGPAAYEILSPAAASTWIRNMVAGVYIYRLTITDNNGYKAFDDVMITVTSPLTTAAITGNRAMNVLTEPAAGGYDHTSLMLFPNPVKNTINMQLTGSYQGTVLVTILDASGVLVKKTIISKNAAEFNGSMPLTELKQGIYHVQVQMGNETIVRKNIFKQ